MKLSKENRDVVEQLRELAWMDEAHSNFVYEEAADEIERLRARVAKMHSGYQEIANASDVQMRDGDLARRIAIEMLQQ